MEDGFEVVNLHGCASGVIPTPTIGTNGNWFVGNKDTDVAAKGETGEAGPQGLKGDQGEIGPAGPQGIQGIQGEKGEKGDQGIQGETGDQGEKGDQGIQGIQGEKGDQGIQGIQGEKGDQGEKGTDADPAELERLSGEIDAVNQSLSYHITTINVESNQVSITGTNAVAIDKIFTVPNGYRTVAAIPRSTSNGVWSSCDAYASNENTVHFTINSWNTGTINVKAYAVILLEKII